jgi:hypothetical protein
MAAQDPALLIAVVVAVSAALLVFSAALLGGVHVVRRLGLLRPDDVPDACRYSPPAPPLAQHADGATARQVAAAQDRRRALFARAWDLRRAAITAQLEQHETAAIRAERSAAADRLLPSIGLDPASLDAADQQLAALEQTPTAATGHPSA